MQEYGMPRIQFQWKKVWDNAKKVASEILAEDILRPHNEKEVQY